MRYVIFDEYGNIGMAHDKHFDGSTKIDYDVVYVDGKFYKDGEAHAALSERDLLFLSLRCARDIRIAAVSWMRERHTDELLLGKNTTLTEQQYLSVIGYIQELRDLPAQEGAPFDGGGEQTPWPTPPKV